MGLLIGSKREGGFCGAGNDPYIDLSDGYKGVCIGLKSTAFNINQDLGIVLYVILT